MKGQDVLHSSESTEWYTPWDVFDSLDVRFGPFTLDPCATDDNAKCGYFFTEEDDGLAQRWAPHKVFMNPPYGRGIAEWVRKARRAAQQGAVVCCLLPARTDTKWWHDEVEPYASVIEFQRGRIKFGGSANSAPFPSVVVVFGVVKKGV